MSSDIPDQFVKIHLLTPLTAAEEASFLSAITQPRDKYDDDYIKPVLVPWPSPTPGSVESDLVPLYKRLLAARGEDEYHTFFYFADRRSISEGSTIIAERDWYSICISDVASQQLSKIADEEGIELPTRDWHEMDGVAEALTDEIIERGVAWGREKGSCWRASFANLDIGNMSMWELVDEVHGGKTEVLLDPEWDRGPFVRRLREEMGRLKENGAWEKGE